MNISAVVSNDIIKREGLIKNRVYLLNFTIIALALMSGTVLYILAENSLSGEIWRVFKAFCFDFSSKSQIEVFSGVLLSHIPYLILMIIFGTSSLGCYFVTAISFIKVTGIGVLSSYLYSSFGLKGIEYCLLIFFPGKFFMIFSVLFLMHSCINNSLYVKKLTKGECSAEKSSNLYAIKAVTAALLFVFSSLIDCVLSVSFSSLFDF